MTAVFSSLCKHDDHPLQTHSYARPLRPYTGESYSTFPPDDTSIHRAAAVRISASSKCLYATTRGGRNSTSFTKRYLSAFALNEHGIIASQDYLTPTTTGGGGSSQVVSSPFDGNYFAILDTLVEFRLA
ncbi:hypothetical protein EJ08DRAFT_700370 [Tothia fuscella]|uniref:Uncharacterized protein n=1 Tax=Tothia fuscella TaxID=1048955 RepID=A0A9P4NLB0_9PEZI|nr:hypothetical protein EJ08DRAFT_700370 [Tothia fuscella]